MDALTIHEAAQTTGWSARMLRYIEQAGLIDPVRSPGGYRLYGEDELILRWMRSGRTRARQRYARDPGFVGRRRGRIAQEFSSRLHPVLRSACRQPALSACFGARPGRGNPERAIVLQPRRALVSQQGAADFT